MECYRATKSSLDFGINRILDCVHSNEQHRPFKVVVFVCLLMTNKKQLITALTLTTILITGAFNLTPLAYSTGWNHDDDNDDNDKKFKICHIPQGNPENAHTITISKSAWDAHKEHGDHKGECNDDQDDGEDCECKKPTIFTVKYNGPGTPSGTGPNAPVTIEIYKKTDDIGKKPPLLTIPDISNDSPVVVNSNTFGKEKLEANTIYRVMQNSIQIAVVSIHTSCSQPLFIGNVYSDSSNTAVTLTVESGTDSEGKQAIFLKHDPICEGVTLTVTKILEPPEDLGRFILQIDNVDMTGPVGNGETTGPKLLMPGIHMVSEIAASGTNLADYTRTISGDCNADGSIELEEGENVECVITNTVKIPATITIKKTIMNDNGQLGTPDDFRVTMFDVGPNGQPGGGDDIQVAQDNFVTMPPMSTSMGKVEFTVPAGTYSLNEDITDSGIDPNSYNTVLIAGDACPSMEDEAFTLNEGDHITCTIYNNDNGDDSSGGDGIIFHRNSLLFTYNGFGMSNPLSGDGACVMAGSVSPCIERIGDKEFRVKDPKLNKDSAIVVFNVFPTIDSGNDDAFSDECRIFRVSLGTGSDLNFEFTCTEITGDNGEDIGPKHYRINYAVIDTM